MPSRIEKDINMALGNMLIKMGYHHKNHHAEVAAALEKYAAKLVDKPLKEES